MPRLRLVETLGRAVWLPIVCALFSGCGGKHAALDSDFTATQTEQAIGAQEQTSNNTNLEEIALVRATPADLSHSTAVDGAADAIRKSTEAIRIDPRNATAYRERAALFQRAGDYARALGDYDTAILLDPDNAATYSNRGDLFATMQRYDRAFPDFDRAIQMNPTEPVFYMNRGVAHCAKGNYQAAIADYDTALGLGSELVEIYENRGIALLKKREFDTAMVDLSEAIRRKPTDGRFYFERGTAFSKLNDYENAIADYRHAVRLAPDDVRAYNNLAWMLATCSNSKFRDAAAAVNYATTALALDPEKQPALLGTLAAAKAEAGDFEAAVRWQRRYLATVLVTPPEETARLLLYESGHAYHESQ